jgi:predicted aspartyl protease
MLALVARLALTTATCGMLLGCSAEAMREANLDRSKVCTITPLGELPLTVEANHVWLPVTVNGKSGPGMLDTGAFASYIDPGQAIMIKRHADGGLIGMASASGTGLARWRWIGEFSVGPLHWTKDVRVIVSPPPTIKGRPQTIAGVGIDFLGKYDYDIDFPHRRMTIYATENCVHPEPPWPTKSTGIPIERIEHGFGLVIPVEFDAGTVNAQIDTGAGYTTMTRGAAEHLGLTRAQILADPTDYVEDVFKGGAHSTIHWHSFPELVVGEDLLKNQKIGVFEKYGAADNQVGMILGMDYLQTRHFWLSLSTDALFIDSGELKDPPGKPKA